MMLQSFIVILISQFVRADWYHDTKAFEITSENVRQIIGKEKHVILDFFTPWCIYCQYMAADWNRVWEFYNGPQGVRIEDLLIAKINCGDEANMPICREFEVRSFPTISYFEQGSNTTRNNFHGNRHYPEFIKWIDELCPQSEQQKIRTAEILNNKEVAYQQHLAQEEQQKQDKEVKQEVLVQKDPSLIKHKIIDFDGKIKELASKFEDFVEANQQIKELELSLTQLDEKITILHRLGSQVNWYHSLVFIISGAFLGVLISFVLVKHYSNKTEFEEKSV